MKSPRQFYDLTLIVLIIGGALFLDMLKHLVEFALVHMFDQPSQDAMLDLATDVENIPCLIDAGFRDEGAFVRFAGDQSLALEQGEGLADPCPAGSEYLGQFRLLQARPRAEASFGDGKPDTLCNLFGRCGGHVLFQYVFSVS